MSTNTDEAFRMGRFVFPPPEDEVEPPHLPIDQWGQPSFNTNLNDQADGDHHHRWGDLSSTAPGTLSQAGNLFNAPSSQEDDLLGTISGPDLNDFGIFDPHGLDNWNLLAPGQRSSQGVMSDTTDGVHSFNISTFTHPTSGLASSSVGTSESAALPSSMFLLDSDIVPPAFHGQTHHEVNVTNVNPTAPTSGQSVDMASFGALNIPSFGGSVPFPEQVPLSFADPLGRNLREVGSIPGREEDDVLASSNQWLPDDNSANSTHGMVPPNSGPTAMPSPPAHSTRRAHGSHTANLSVDIRGNRIFGLAAPHPEPATLSGNASDTGSTTSHGRQGGFDIGFYGSWNPSGGVTVMDLMRMCAYYNEDLSATEPDERQNTDEPHIPVAPSTSVAMAEPSTSALPPQTSTSAVPPQTSTSAVPPQTSTSAVPPQTSTSAIPPQTSAPGTAPPRPPTMPGSSTPLSVSSFIPAETVRGDLLETRAFAIEVFKSDQYTPAGRTTVIDCYIQNLVISWGKNIIGHLICSGSSVTAGDLFAYLLPFSNALEVTLAVSIGANFSLAGFSVKYCRTQGWRNCPGGQAQVNHYETHCINPALGQLQDFFMQWLIESCRFTITHVLCNRRIFPKFAELWGIAGELMRALLEYAASGGYMHWLGTDSSVVSYFSNFQNFELFLKHVHGSKALLIIKNIVNKTPDSKGYFIRYFQHLSLAYITNFNVDWLCRHGALVAVQMFIKGRNPFLSQEYSGVPTPSRLPPWISLTYISSGIISVVLGALEQMGPTMLSAEAIVKDSTIMILYAIKVSCTKRLIHELWAAPKAKNAQADLEWVASFNFWKADMATHPTHLITNIPSLFSAWDVAQVPLPPSRIRGVVPVDYTAGDFIEEFLRLREAFSTGERDDRHIERIRMYLENIFVRKISKCTQDVIGEAGWPHVQEHLLQISQDTYNERSLHGGEETDDPTVASLQRRMATLRQKGEKVKAVSSVIASRRQRLSGSISGSGTCLGHVKRKATASMTTAGVRGRTSAPQASGSAVQG